MTRQHHDMQVREAIYVGGEWVSSGGVGTLDVYDAATEEVIGRIPGGVPEDVDRAVGAARAAFDGWSRTPVEERGRWMARIATELERRQAEIGDLIAREVGMPQAMSRMVQAWLPMVDFATMRDALGEISWEEQVGTSLVLREPVGVVGAITPWNYPLHQIAAKLAPALAAGCTVVLKPSEVAPLNAFLLADVLHELELPAGVFNLVSGVGPVVGESLAAHPDVDMVSFTGSTSAGRRISELAAGTVKRVALELGGKSANVILDDADLQEAVADGVTKAYLNGGQACAAQSRMLVPRSRLAEAERLAAAAAEQFKPGDPFDPATTLGPMVSDAQRARVRRYIDLGRAEGATLVCGGTEAPEGLDRGWFVRPTVFSDVTPEMTIAREEIFGPVLSIMPYDDEDDAVRIANDSVYGLSGAVWSADAERAKRVARRIRTGQVEINGGAYNPVAPFGGYKQSGTGRELGRFGLEEYLEVKAMQL